MAKDKKFKGGPDRKAYLSSMAGKGRASSQYLKYKDYDKSDVFDSMITYTHRGRNYEIRPASTDKDVFAKELIDREGKLVGDPFMHRGSLYKIKAGASRGQYEAELVEK